MTCSLQSRCGSMTLELRRHHLAHVLGDGAHLHRIGPDHAELHREADRRAEHEAVDARARRRQRAVGDRLLEPRLDALARLEVLGDDDDLREVRVRQHRIEAEPEARRALPHIGRVGRDVVVAARSAARPSSRSHRSTPIAVPSGRRISRNSSVRVEVGKNCCCTKPKPAIEATNISTVDERRPTCASAGRTRSRGAARDRCACRRSRRDSRARRAWRSRAAASARDRA